MNWQEFEILVGKAFRQQGFSFIETGCGAAGGFVVTYSVYTAEA